MFAALRNPTVADGPAGRQLLWWIISLSLLVRLGFAIFTPLGVDETYAIAVAREFSLSFFDHPPLGFWSPVVAANLTGLEHALIYRLPTLVYGTLTLPLLYGIGRLLGGAQAGLWAALLFAVAPSFVLTGVFVLPDGPLGLGSAFAVYWLVRIVQAGYTPPQHYWLLAGAGLAVALASKYQAGLIPISALVFASISPTARRWFVRPGLYLGIAVALTGLLPLLIWNIQNDWISFSFHSGRTGKGLNAGNFLGMAVGQAIYLLPPVLLLAIAGIVRAMRRREPAGLLLALVALGPIVAFNIVYLFSANSFPHWTMPGWMFALPLAGVWLAEASPTAISRAMNWLRWTAIPVFLVLGLAVLHLNTGALTRFGGSEAPRWDDTSKSFNYNRLRAKLEERNLLENVSLIATSSWIEAGMMSTALQGDYPLRVLGTVEHHFALMSGKSTSGKALILHPETLSAPPRKIDQLFDWALELDPQAQRLDPVILDRGGVPYLAVRIITLTISPPKPGS